MKKAAVFPILLVLILSSCNIPKVTQEALEQDDIVATQVAQMLTQVREQTVDIPVVTDEPAVQQPTETTQPSATPEPTATNTPLPTSTPTNTPTLTPDLSDPAITLGSPTWTNEFSAVSSVWEYADTETSFHVADGFLNIKSYGYPYWHGWYVTSPKIEDFYLEMTYNMPVCSGSDYIGLAFRSPDGTQFYFMAASCNGSWGFYRMDSTIKVNTILSFAPSGEFKPAPNVNRIGVKANGTSFEFYVNGKKVGSASDSTLKDAGKIGFVTSFVENSGFTTRVDKLQYWLLP